MFINEKTAYEMRISDWSSDVCSSDLNPRPPRNEPNEPVGSRAPKVLCVDDNPANLLLVQTLLEDMGAKVLAVESGYAAVKAVQKETFDLVLMDVQMR